ncbi:MAG TPA: helix-turn-helix transcriptional regulator [Candidatus Saccharimonadia bacterium]|nr:helix-turn-helix transcriptional regulator [Candidatus Saccharimonadia bacterium]
MISLGREIKKARIDKGWNQKALQDATGISQKHISAIELDKVDPRWSMVKRLACALDLDVAALARGEKTEEPR